MLEELGKQAGLSEQLWNKVIPYLPPDSTARMALQGLASADLKARQMYHGRHQLKPILIRIKARAKERLKKLRRAVKKGQLLRKLRKMRRR